MCKEMESRKEQLEKSISREMADRIIEFEDVNCAIVRGVDIKMVRILGKRGSADLVIKVETKINFAL